MNAVPALTDLTYADDLPDCERQIAAALNDAEPGTPAFTIPCGECHGKGSWTGFFGPTRPCERCAGSGVLPVGILSAESEPSLAEPSQPAPVDDWEQKYKDLWDLWMPQWYENQGLLAELDRLRAALPAPVDEEALRLRNALRWIRLNAGMHYMGGAFDPEHMAALADMASDALNGEPVEDFDAAMAAAKERAKEWADLFVEDPAPGVLPKAEQ